MERSQVCIYNNGSNQDIISRIMDWDKTNPPKTVILTGHSLGAAVSALTYIQLVKNHHDMGLNFINLSFGCPMFGNIDLRNWVQGAAQWQL